MSRNDSFLKEDYEYICELLENDIFLMAPHRVVKAMNETDILISVLDRISQECFRDKEEINRGIKQFIADYIERFGGLGLEPSPKFVDRYYRYCFGGAMEFSNAVRFVEDKKE